MTEPAPPLVQAAVPGGREPESSWPQLAASASLGLLIGLLVALSRTPVARDVTLALVTLLAAFLGLKGKAGSGNSLRVLGLSLGCVLSVCVGIWMRNHDLLSPPRAPPVPHPLAQKSLDDLQKMFGAQDGQRLWLLSQLGEIPPGVLGKPYDSTSDKPASPEPKAPAAPSLAAPGVLGTALVAEQQAEAAAASCGALVEQYAQLDLQQAKDKYSKRPELNALPELLDTLQVKDPRKTLTALGKLACRLAEKS